MRKLQTIFKRLSPAWQYLIKGYTSQQKITRKRERLITIVIDCPIWYNGDLLMHLKDADNGILLTEMLIVRQDDDFDGSIIDYVKGDSAVDEAKNIINGVK